MENKITQEEAKQILELVRNGSKCFIAGNVAWFDSTLFYEGGFYVEWKDYREHSSGKDNYSEDKAIQMLMRKTHQETKNFLAENMK